jgi:tripartite-type tricarboxylate transporter receptor subunit TctC
VPFSPGGGADTLALTLQPRSGKPSSSTIAVERAAGPAGKLGAVAVADKKCSAILLEVPTAAETGVAGIGTGSLLEPARRSWSCRSFHTNVMRHDR